MTDIAKILADEADSILTQNEKVQVTESWGNSM